MQDFVIVVSLFPRAELRPELCSGKYMEVQVINCLPGVSAAVGDNAEA